MDNVRRKKERKWVGKTVADFGRFVAAAAVEADGDGGNLKTEFGCAHVCFVRSRAQNMGQWTNHLVLTLLQYVLRDVGGDTRRSD